MSLDATEARLISNRRNGRPLPVPQPNGAGLIQDMSVIFVAGLPRSGSTLLMNLLGQNARHAVTPSSGLVDMLVSVRDAWMHNPWFRAQGLKIVRPHVRSMMRGMIMGFHHQAFISGRTVFEKNRTWPAYIELLEEVLGRRVKIIMPVRDIKAIVASFEKLFRSSAMTKHREEGAAYYECQSMEGRIRSLFLPDSVLGLAVNRLRDALDRGLEDRLVFVPYLSLVNQTTTTMDALHEWLGLPSYQYDPKNVEQVTREDDTVYGMELHDIRSEVEAPHSAVWEGILPERICAWLDREYSDINELALTQA